MSRFQILCLTGGGIRGAFITSYLCQLEKRLGRPIADSFDLICGTSTGGIIATLLAAGQSAAEVQTFYEEHGADCFTSRPPYHPPGLWKLVYPMADWVFRRFTNGNLDAAFRSRFCPDSLESALREGFSDTKLSDIRHTRLVVPAFNLTSGRTHLFRSQHLPSGVGDRDVEVVEMLVAATAAPTYFPHHMVRGDAMIDAGVWAADPSVVGYAEAMRILQFENDGRTPDAAEAETVRLLSIGTGRVDFTLCPPGSDAGLIYWAPRLADVMQTAQVQGSHLPLKFLLGDRYQHVNFRLQDRWPLDGVENMPALFAAGTRRADETYERIHEQFLGHVRRKFDVIKEETQAIKLDDFGLFGSNDLT